MNIERIKRKFIFDSFEEAFDIHRKISQEIREKGFMSYTKLRYIWLKENKRTYKNEYDELRWKNLWYSRIYPNDDYNWVLEMPVPIRLKRKGR